MLPATHSSSRHAADRKSAYPTVVRIAADAFHFERSLSGIRHPVQRQTFCESVRPLGRDDHGLLTNFAGSEL